MSCGRLSYDIPCLALLAPACVYCYDCQTDAMRRIAAAGSTTMNINGIPSWK